MARLQKESAPKRVTIFQKRVVMVTQLRLAHIQQLHSDIADLHHQVSKEWAQVRKDILKGASVQSGPIRAFIRKSRGKKKLVIK